jgi:hypothetical protein
MPGFVLQAERPVEYAILIRPRPAGPLLGFYRDQPIAEAVIDHFGCRYIFAGIATRRRDGKYDARLLGKEERLMEPGLVYRRLSGQAPSQ